MVSVLFLIIGITHGLRIFYGWEVQLGMWDIPMWASYIAVVAALCLSFQGFHLAKKV